MMALPYPALAKSSLEAVKIGDVTTFTGEVLIRINGKWSRLERVPQPIYSSDKVVTRQGRAEIGFADGGILRLDIDTNISISQTKEKKGLFSKKETVSRQVNVLVGKFWVDVKIKKGNKLRFRTPSMVAAIKVSQLIGKVRPDGSTEVGKKGQVELSGNYNETAPKEISSDDVNMKPGSLPQSDPEVDNSDMQRLARQSVQRTDAAKQTVADADTRLENTNKSNIKEQALAAAAKAEAASAEATANIISAEEVLAEAVQMGDEGAATKAQELLDGILEIADKSAEAAQQASAMSDAALGAKTSEAAQTYAASALAYGSAAKANSNATSAAVNVAEIAVSDDDKRGVTAAQGEVEKAKERANQATAAAQKAQSHAKAAVNAATPASASASVGS